MSVHFDPVRLGPRRRRLDPLVFGVIAVAFALAVAVLKPWDAGYVVTAPGRPLTANAPPASALLEASPRPATIRLVSAQPPSWADISSIVTPHDAWGIRVIATGAAASAGPSNTTAFTERWSPVTTAPDGTMTASVVRDDGRSIAILGVTAPLDEVAADARIWRVHRDGQLEWVAAVAIVTGDVNGSLLYVRPGGGGTPFDAWEGGRYRIDVLVRDGIRRLEIVVPNRFGAVQPPDELAPSPVASVAAEASDLSGVPVGPFATTDGVGVPFVTSVYRPLTEDQAWNDLILYGGSHVASLALPRATGLGVMLAPGSIVATASIARLAPDSGPFDAPPPSEGATEHPPRARYVIFAAPDGGVWRPGVYALTVTWTDDTGLERGTWHVQLDPSMRPGA